MVAVVAPKDAVTHGWGQEMTILLGKSLFCGFGLSFVALFRHLTSSRGSRADPAGLGWDGGMLRDGGVKG